MKDVYTHLIQPSISVLSDVAPSGPAYRIFPGHLLTLMHEGFAQVVASITRPRVGWATSESALRVSDESRIWRKAVFTSPFSGARIGKGEPQEVKEEGIGGSGERQAERAHWQDRRVRAAHLAQGSIIHRRSCCIALASEGSEKT